MSLMSVSKIWLLWSMFLMSAWLSVVMSYVSDVSMGICCLGIFMSAWMSAVMALILILDLVSWGYGWYSQCF